MLAFTVLTGFCILVYCVDSLNPNRIAFGSCNRNNQQSLWHIVQSHEPSRLLLLGDNMYADKKLLNFKFVQADPTQLQNAYKQLGSDTDFQRLLSSVGGMNAVHATYDDHDYGINDGDATYEYKKESMYYFKSFFTNNTSPSRYIHDDGVYSSSVVRFPISSKNSNNNNSEQLYNNIKIIMLDVRYNKIKSTVSTLFTNKQSTPKCTILGSNQWRWFEQELSSSIIPDPITGELIDLILIGSGTQIIPQGKLIEETWDKDCPEDRERILQIISGTVYQSRYSGGDGSQISIMLLSGDGHGAELSQVNIYFYINLYMIYICINI